MEDHTFFTSPYNFQIPLQEAILIYSAFSGAVVSLSGEDAISIAQRLSGDIRPIELSGLPEMLADQLRNGGFVTVNPAEQLRVIKERFRAARSDYPVVLTLTTTMDCNLGCYYCYEQRSAERLEKADISQLLSYVQSRLRGRNRPRLHVDWYGGEPLLNCEFLEAASYALQDLCHKLSIPYSASIISNGTCWPADPGKFVLRHKINQVQISFDGMRQNHNRRRRYRNNDDQKWLSSFDEAARLVAKLLDFTKVDIRFNIDAHNATDLVPFIRFARAQGWFERRYPAAFQPARLASYTERSSFMRKSELTIAQYDALRELARTELGHIVIEESEAPDGFPFPKTSVCCALSDDSIVVGADGRTYRCALQVSESKHSVGSIRSDSKPFRILNNAAEPPDSRNQEWWQAFDPTEAPRCSKCSFLPICWGGCPKKHFDGDAHALREQGIYWRRNLARLVASSLGLQLPSISYFEERDQFRETVLAEDSGAQSRGQMLAF
jgi:uncharacterized protein